jgi:hypothetical protein
MPLVVTPLFSLILIVSYPRGNLSLSKAHSHRWFKLSQEEEMKMWDQSMMFGLGPRACLGKE